MQKRIVKLFIVTLLTTAITASLLIGCKKETDPEKTYNLEQFENAMMDKGYEFEMQDAEQDFLPTTRKRMLLDNDLTLDIYLFKNNAKMEEEASRIDINGAGYSGPLNNIKVSWVSVPHFYKKGTLIVQYIGEDEAIISTLKDILGEQFAGFTP
ncbi:MAG: hypothetical protein QM644_19585 [Mobilitalea sp.]